MEKLLNQKSQKQPKVFYFATITSLFERHGFYVINFLLTLYLKKVYNLSDNEAFAMFALFTALSFILTVLCGYISDFITGIKRCMGFGLVLEMIGLFILAIPFQNLFMFNSALAFIIVGSGFFKTCPTNLMARSYEKDDNRVDAGFTLYYMGMNIGAFISTFTGSTYEFWGWSVPFFLGGLGLLIGLIWFVFFKKDASSCDVEKGNEHFPLFHWLLLFLFALALVIGCFFLLNNIRISNILLYSSCFILLLYFVYEIIVRPVEEKEAIITCLVLMVFVLVFSLFYFQAFTSMELFIERCINRTAFGFKIPTVWYISLNPIWIFILSPILAFLYEFLGKRNKDLSIVTKFPLGVLLTAIGFFLLSLCTYFPLANGLISSWWMILVFFFNTTGELLTCALGFSMIAQISPKRLYGVMTGAWYIYTYSLAANLSGILAGKADVPEQIQNNIPEMLKIYDSAFLYMGMIAFVTAIVGFIIAPWLKRMSGLNNNKVKED